MVCFGVQSPRPLPVFVCVKTIADSRQREISHESAQQAVRCDLRASCDSRTVAKQLKSNKYMRTVAIPPVDVDGDENESVCLHPTLYSVDTKYFSFQWCVLQKVLQFHIQIQKDHLWTIFVR